MVELETELISRRALLRAAALAAPVAAGLRHTWTSGFSGSPPVAQLSVRWDRVARVSRTTPTLQVVANPLLRRSSPVHHRVFANLRSLGADQVRYVAWYPYPRLSVAELEPPTRGTTSWDFSHMDPLVVDFMQATRGHSPILNLSTTPAWMWQTPEPVTVPTDPDVVDFGYMRGTTPAVPVSRVGDYYRRLVAWYTRGGFVDELGRRHSSGHRMTFDYWEVLNEIDAEHTLSPQLYVRLYDAIVDAVRRVSPRTEFLGLALSLSGLRDTDYVRYFLSAHHHRPGIPLHWISYHFYAIPSVDAVAEWGPTSFSQVDAFLATVDRVEAIRARLSPHTRTAVDEAGTLLRRAATQVDPEPIPSAYWNYSAAVFAYMCANLALRGIDLVAQSQLVGYPGQYPSVTMLDWRTGLPNARYRVLELLLRHLRPGDRLYRSRSSAPSLYGLGSRSPDGERRVLLVNKTYRPLEVRLTGLRGATIDVVDQRSGGGPPRRVPRLPYDALRLPGYGVAVARLITRGPRRASAAP